MSPVTKAAFLANPQIFRRFLATVGDDVKRDLGALDQRAEACLLDGRDMDEYVLAAGVRRDEPITLLPVKQLDRTYRHVRTPFKIKSLY
jgi:hypothetical protein